MTNPFAPAAQDAIADPINSDFQATADAGDGEILIDFNADNFADPYGVFDVECVGVRTAAGKVLIDFNILEEPFTSYEKISVWINPAERRQVNRLKTIAGNLGIDLVTGPLRIGDERFKNRPGRAVIGEFNNEPSIVWGGKSLAKCDGYMKWLEANGDQAFAPDSPLIKNTCGILPPA